ncbi:MAG: helix-turn-helix transcriptional regulator [Oscillospiraceae bacterium]|nr:helix-turn-helix transcriptional regulator [Oscillospiraceae bacterium]
MDYCETIQKSIDYIENNLENEIDLKKVAKESYMALSNFYKMFFTYVGYPANEYIRLRRMCLAAQDLEHNNWRIIDISTKYQFENADSFARTFKRITGFLPSEYRYLDKNNHYFNFERIDIMAKVIETEVKNQLQDNEKFYINQLLCKTNHELIKGKVFSDTEKKSITDVFLANISSEDDIGRFNKGVKSPQDGRIMYPLFYIPPYNPKKFITITGVMPNTHIFSTNHYELEILRLLALWRRDDEKVQDMLVKTKERLKTTCFGQFCSVGECFEASISALRFLTAAFPNEIEWINKLINGISEKMDAPSNGGKRRSGVYLYYWLALSDLDLPIADGEIKRYCPELEKIAAKRVSYDSEYDKLFNPISLYISRNCLSRFAGHSHIKESEGSVGDDGKFGLTYPKYDIIYIMEQQKAK